VIEEPCPPLTGAKSPGSEAARSLDDLTVRRDGPPKVNVMPVVNGKATLRGGVSKRQRPVSTGRRDPVLALPSLTAGCYSPILSDALKRESSRRTRRRRSRAFAPALGAFMFPRPW